MVIEPSVALACASSLLNPQSASLTAPLDKGAKREPRGSQEGAKV